MSELQKINMWLSGIWLNICIIVNLTLPTCIFGWISTLLLIKSSDIKVSVRIAPICVTDEVETWHKINRINVVENGTTPFNWHDLWLFQIFNWVQQRQKYTFRTPRNLNCLNVIGNFNLEMSNKYYHYKFSFNANGKWLFRQFECLLLHFYF